MTRRHTIDGIAVNFLEILDILLPKIRENGGKSAQKRTVFREIKKAQR